MSVHCEAPTMMMLLLDGQCKKEEGVSTIFQVFDQDLGEMGLDGSPEMDFALSGQKMRTASLDKRQSDKDDMQGQS